MIFIPHLLHVLRFELWSFPTAVELILRIFGGAGVAIGAIRGDAFDFERPAAVTAFPSPSQNFCF
jgi:hypothetical protein